MKHSEIINRNYRDVKLTALTDRAYTLKDGTHKVVLRIYHNRKYVILSTGYHDSDLPDAYEAISKYVDRVYSKLRSHIDDGTFTLSTAKAIVSNMDKKEVGTLNELIRRKIERLDKDEKCGTVVHYKAMLRNLERTCGQIPLSGVCCEALRPFAEGIRNMASATQTIYLNDLKSVINEAVAKGYLKESQLPFKKGFINYDTDKIAIPKSGKRTEAFLTWNEMKMVMEWNSDHKDKYVDMFILSYLLGGINLADMIRLKFDAHYKGSDCREFRYIRTKTKSRVDFAVRVPVTDKAKDIIERVKHNDEYLFDTNGMTDRQLNDYKFNLTVRINNHLGSMAQKLGIDKKVTMTYARHSFATIANRRRLPYNFIEAVMGHTNNEISSHYVAGYSTEEMLELMQEMLL